MRFSHSFQVNAPVEAVRQFHMQPEGVARLTPPPVIVRIGRAPERIAPGEMMEFTLWFGPLPVRWQAYFEDVSAAGFTDRQLRGPFQYWVHRHAFLPLDGQRSEVRDEVEISLRRHPFWGPFGLLMRLSLPGLFAYRRWRTRRLLEK
jgi:ligand-binding SRPBCC domain-containing protein